MAQSKCLPGRQPREITSQHKTNNSLKFTVLSYLGTLSFTLEGQEKNTPFDGRILQEFINRTRSKKVDIDNNKAQTYLLEVHYWYIFWIDYLRGSLAQFLKLKQENSEVIMYERNMRVRIHVYLCSHTWNSPGEVIFSPQNTRNIQRKQNLKRGEKEEKKI